MVARFFKWFLTRECAGMTEESLLETMEFSAKVAAITCTRSGADPPKLAEVS